MTDMIKRSCLLLLCASLAPMAEGAAGADEVRRGEGVERHLPANER